MSTVLVGDQVYMFHYIAQYHACRMHLRGPLPWSRRSPIAHVKRTYGYKGSNESVVRQFGHDLYDTPNPVATMAARLDAVVQASAASVPRS